MRADAAALTTRREGGPRVLQKTTKERAASRVTALVLHGVVKATDEGTEGGLEERRRRGGLKSPGSLKSALSFSRTGTMGRVLDGQPGARPYPACLYLFT